MIVDAHQHFWDPARDDYGWLRPDSPLHRAYGSEHLAPLMRSAGVTGSILVQAAPTAEETDFLLDIARRTRWILGVVGSIDLAARDVAAQVERRADDLLFVGVRPMLQDMADRNWILRPELAAGLQALSRHHLVFDALVNADQLSAITKLAKRYPGLAIVLDHAGKPPFGDAVALGKWRIALSELAHCPNVACKLSGLTTELPAGGPAEPVENCIDMLIGLFGPDRLLWGSDWPVATLSTDYFAWFDLCRSRVAKHLPSSHAAIFGDNARCIYRLTTDRCDPATGKMNHAPA
jgi:L-fuconolactonase